MLRQLSVHRKFKTQT